MFREGTELRARPTGSAEMSSWDLGLIVLGEAALLALAVIGEPVWYLQLPRILLGLLTTLFVPGYALTAALLPRASDLDGTERVAASFGLSWAIIPPIALLLDRLPSGLRLWPMLISLAVFSLVCATIARSRRQTAARETPAAGATGGGAGESWKSRGGKPRLALATIMILVIALTAAALSMVTGPNSDRSTTEFYLLGPDGLAEGYPRENRMGEPVVATVGIANHEASRTAFRVEATEGGRVVGQTPSILVNAGVVRELPLTFIPFSPSEDDEVTISLYRDGETNAYRTLVLWLNVAPAGTPPAGATDVAGGRP